MDYIKICCILSIFFLISVSVVFGETKIPCTLHDGWNVRGIMAPANLTGNRDDRVMDECTNDYSSLIKFSCINETLIKQMVDCKYGCLNSHSDWSYGKGDTCQEEKQFQADLIIDDKLIDGILGTTHQPYNIMMVVSGNVPGSVFSNCKLFVNNGYGSERLTVEYEDTLNGSTTLNEGGYYFESTVIGQAQFNFREKGDDYHFRISIICPQIYEISEDLDFEIKNKQEYRSVLHDINETKTWQEQNRIMQDELNKAKLANWIQVGLLVIALATLIATLFVQFRDIKKIEKNLKKEIKNSILQTVSNSYIKIKK